MQKYTIGRKRSYNPDYINRNDVILWEVLNIKSNQDLNIKFLSTNSQYIQGIRLGIDYGKGEIEINGIRSKHMLIWEDTIPQSKEFNAKIISQTNRISIYNIWRKEDKMASQMYGSGMIAEQITENKVIYHCNDLGIVETFDKLVFEITF